MEGLVFFLIKGSMFALMSGDVWIIAGFFALVLVVGLNYRASRKARPPAE